MPGAVLRLVKSEGYKVDWILETHPHADQLTAGHWLAERTGAPHGIGPKVEDIADLWREYYNRPNSLLRCVSEACDRCIAALTACVVVVLP
ncbi:MBL fold metallo-hydrolase [Loktanella sp. 5RATIMAR09]|uniref:MBL fold metallo-hydrolase n=1 Tax=Loktanella sp. 5RATIMAR09 TaxID=1225655 RepID=UPI00336C118B